MELVDLEQTTEQTAGSHTLSAAIRDASPAQWGLAIVLLLMAYEWLISGLDKVFNRDYVHGLAGELRESLPDNPNQWYVHFLNRVILPHATAVAVLVEVGELLVAVGLVAGAIWWLTGSRLPATWARVLYAAVLAALVGSALMTANYYFMDGQRLPWLKTGDPFDEGLGIDGLLTLVALALLAVHLVARRQRGDQPA